ncbi:transposase [Cuniculiplasma sp. SKW4]|uniref:transposase n=1 Tax=Cuniculiplasma sp. SKW4 TaxID=3400171 RepID=UPI003FD4513F
MPRDRNNKFQTALFKKYQRNVGIDDPAVSMHSKGIPTRKMAEILEELIHKEDIKSIIWRITEIRIKRNNIWRSRHLIIDTVEKECDIFAME